MNIERLYEKLSSVDDEELKNLVLELIEENNQLDSDASLDELTGAYNRRVLKKIRYNGIVAICDIDDFKNINDTYGHDYGDKVLKEFAQKLKSRVRSDDVVCRFGGDEFVVIFKGCPLDMAKLRLEIIRTELIDKNITFSAGLAEYNSNDNIYSVIEKADNALYNAKLNGKNKIGVYKEDKELQLKK